MTQDAPARVRIYDPFTFSFYLDNSAESLSHHRWGIAFVQKTASPALPLPPASPPQDARALLAHVETEVRHRIQAFDIAVPVALTEKTIRSMLADIEIKAHGDGATLDTTACRLDGIEVATAYSFERKLGGIGAGIHDGIVVLSPHWERHLTPWLCHRLQDLTGFELATFRIPGVKMPEAAPDQFTIRNRSMTAIMKGDRVQEVMPLGSSFQRLLDQTGRGTQRSMKRCVEYAGETGIQFSLIPQAPSLANLSLRKLAAKHLPGAKSLHEMAAAVSFIAAQAQPFHATLTHTDGHPMSMAAGFIEGDLALVAFQLNHRADRDVWPSLMLRAFLIQQLIDQGVRYLGFIGNGAGLLLHSCEQVPAAELLMIRNTRSARFKFWACRLLQPRSRVALIGDRPPEAAAA